MKAISFALKTLGVEGGWFLFISAPSLRPEAMPFHPSFPTSKRWDSLLAATLTNPRLPPPPLYPFKGRDWRLLHRILSIYFPVYTGSRWRWRKRGLTRLSSTVLTLSAVGSICSCAIVLVELNYPQFFVAS
jgi:hypothetical protein